MPVRENEKSAYQLPKSHLSEKSHSPIGTQALGDKMGFWHAYRAIRSEHRGGSARDVTLATTCELHVQACDDDGGHHHAVTHSLST
jgi:hypothetical protein